MGSTKGYNRYYEFLIGGVLMMTPTMYKTLNGFSNMYWGWGGEDDDLSLRLIERRFCVVRPDYSVAVYSGMNKNHNETRSMEKKATEFFFSYLFSITTSTRPTKSCPFQSINLGNSSSTKRWLRANRTINENCDH